MFKKHEKRDDESAFQKLTYFFSERVKSVFNSMNFKVDHQVSKEEHSHRVFIKYQKMSKTEIRIIFLDYSTVSTKQNI